MARARCPRSSMEAGQKCFKFLKERDRATFFSPSENRCLPASNLKPEEREFVVDSDASMHMISKTDLSDAEMDTLTKSCSPTIVITANGEVQTHEEATVYVKELDIFLTMKVLENTPAELSLGKLCDENGYSYEWINGQKPHLIKNGIRIQCITENFVSIVVPGLSSSSSGSSSTSQTPSRQGGLVLHLLQARLLHLRHHQVIMRLEKKRIELKVIPLQCLCQLMLTIERGNPLWTKPTKNFQKQIKRKPKKNGATRCLPIQVVQVLKSRSGCKNSEKIWWMMKFLNAETHTPVHLMKYL